MNAYATMHAALMYAFLGIFILLVAALIVACGLAFLRLVAAAPDGDEDRKGFHQDRRTHQ